MQSVERRRKRKNEIGTRLRVFGISAVYRIAGERWRIAKVLQSAPAIRASAIHSADPRDTYASALRQCFRCAIHYFSYNLVARNYMRNSRRKLAFRYMKIGAAYATGAHFEKNVPRLRFWGRNLLDAQRSRGYWSRRS